MKKNKYLRLVLIFLLPLAFIFSHCFTNSKAATDPRGQAFAGSAACLKCHKEVYRDYLHTAHFLTSRAAFPGAVHGSFQAGANSVNFNDSVQVMMDRHGDSLYQANYVNKKLQRKERFDLVFGSNRGETFLYWKDNKVFQLPVTYYISLHQWANSPGYSSAKVDFNRMIGSRCFECHSSYVKNMADPTGTIDSSYLMDRKSLIMGIDCERCHGPGAAHVDYQTKNPADNQAMYITKISSLSRQQRIDMCSVCHAGNTSIMTKSTFGFKPGDTLNNYTNGEPFHHAQDAAAVDVHGNQVKLLTSSKCFMAGKIECATCHQMHNAGVKTVAIYSKYCTSCHSEAKHNFCKIAAQIGPAIYSNCIDCHMPVKTSHSIVINTGDNKQINPPFLARTHLIAIYPEETSKIMAMLNTKKPAK